MPRAACVHLVELNLGATEEDERLASAARRLAAAAARRPRCADERVDEKSHKACPRPAADEHERDRRGAPRVEPAGRRGRARRARDWPERVDREWALGGSTGAGVRVCILDSGVEAGHPLVGERRSSAVAIVAGTASEPVVEDDGRATSAATAPPAPASSARSRPTASCTACASSAPASPGSGPVLLAGLRWAIEQGFDVINMSLSTTKQQFAGVCTSSPTRAYFQRSVLVASAHNLPVESYPWRFSSVISVGSHEEPTTRSRSSEPLPAGRVLRARRRRRRRLARRRQLRSTGNSFATPHMTAICALCSASTPS